MSYQIIVNRNNQYQNEPDFFEICEANGMLLEDQGTKNVNLFETIMANLPEEVFDEERENYENDQTYLSAVSGGIVNDLNLEKYRKKDPTNFLDDLIREDYGQGAVYLLEILYNAGMDLEPEDILIDMFFAGSLELEDYEDEELKYDLEVKDIIFKDKDGSKYVIVKEDY